MKPNEMHYFFAAENWMELNLEKFPNIIHQGSRSFLMLLAYPSYNTYKHFQISICISFNSQKIYLIKFYGYLLTLPTFHFANIMTRISAAIFQKLKKKGNTYVINIFCRHSIALNCLLTIKKDKLTYKR